MKKWVFLCLVRYPLVQSICECSDNGHPVALDDSDAGKAFMALADELIEKVDLRNTGTAANNKTSDKQIKHLLIWQKIKVLKNVS